MGHSQKVGFTLSTIEVLTMVEFDKSIKKQSARFKHILIFDFETRITSELFSKIRHSKEKI